jgi:hypothetical protein
MPYNTSERMESLLAGTVAVPGLLAWQLVKLALDTLAWLFKRSHSRPLPSTPACMVTGCDTGIGRETAIKLADEARVCGWLLSWAEFALNCATMAAAAAAAATAAMHLQVLPCITAQVRWLPCLLQHEPKFAICG